MKLGLLASFSLAALLLALPRVDAAAAGNDLGIQIVLDPSLKDQKDAPVWLAYALGRANYIQSHPDLYRHAKGRIAPRFEEELKGRTDAVQVYVELKEQDKSLRSPYFEDLEKVRTAGFLKEYVWSYFNPGPWEDAPPPERLAAFKSWMAGNLQGHRPQTYGTIVIK